MTDSPGTPDEIEMAQVKRRRAIVLVVVVLAAVVLYWGSGPVIHVVKGPPKSKLVGCYKGGETMVRLSAEGLLHTQDGNWPYMVTKGDPDMLVIDEAAAAPEGAGVRFSRVPRGQGIRVAASRKAGFKLGNVTFSRASCNGMRRRKS